MLRSLRRPRAETTPASPPSVLSGTYVYAVNGFTGNNHFAVLGIFTADGNGNVTSGTRDTVNDAGGQTLSEAISGTYSVNDDGRGQLVLNGAAPIRPSTALYCRSPSAGKLFQNGTGSTSVVADAIGRLERKPAPSPPPSGHYVFRFDGEDTDKFPYGAIGGLTLASPDNLRTIDENDTGSFNANDRRHSPVPRLIDRPRHGADYPPPDQSTALAVPTTTLCTTCRPTGWNCSAPTLISSCTATPTCSTSTALPPPNQVFNLSGLTATRSSSPH